MACKSAYEPVHYFNTTWQEATIPSLRQRKEKTFTNKSEKSTPPTRNFWSSCGRVNDVHYLNRLCRHHQNQKITYVNTLFSQPL